MGKITVVSATPGRVGLWDKNPAYEGGEVYVGSKPVDVEHTTAVEAALLNGSIVRAEDANKDENGPDTKASENEQVNPATLVETKDSVALNPDRLDEMQGTQDTDTKRRTVKK